MATVQNENTQRSISDVTDVDISQAFQQIAPDLLAACVGAGEKQNRIHVGDAADAVFNYMRLKYTDDAFPRIKKVLRKHWISGRGQYIYL